MESETKERLENLEKGHEQLNKLVKENTEITKNTSDSVQELLDYFKAAKGGIRFITWIGNFIKWTAGISVALISVRVAVKQWLGY